MPGERLTVNTNISDFSLRDGSEDYLSMARDALRARLAGDMVAYMERHGLCMVSSITERRSQHVSNTSSTLALEVWLLPLWDADNETVTEFRAIHLGPPEPRQPTGGPIRRAAEVLFLRPDPPRRPRPRRDAGAIDWGAVALTDERARAGRPWGQADERTLVPDVPE